MSAGPRFRPVDALRGWTDVWSRSGWFVRVHCTTGMAHLTDPRGSIVLSGTEEDCIAQAARLAPQSGSNRAVVLLHGLGHHSGVLAGTEAKLRENGWAVANVDYSSLRMPLSGHASAASRIARTLFDDGAREVSFVGHSLGGLVARTALDRAETDGWLPGRLVLIGSPARGSAMAHALNRMRPYRMLLGECGQSVTPLGAASIPVPACRGIAVIAGGNSGRGFNPLLRGDNDGVVTVDETRLPGREDGFLLVRSLHTPLPGKDETILATAEFLENGYIAA